MFSGSHAFVPKVEHDTPSKSFVMGGRRPLVTGGPSLGCLGAVPDWYQLLILQ